MKSDRQVHGYKIRQAVCQEDRWADRQADRQTGKHAGRQVDLSRRQQLLRLARLIPSSRSPVVDTRDILGLWTDKQA